MPTDSYVLDYFSAQKSQLAVGPPVYFVVESGFNYSDWDKQNLICSSAGCAPTSLTGLISDAAKHVNVSYITMISNSWVDDYNDWAAQKDCCRLYKNNKEFCPSSEGM